MPTAKQPTDAGSRWWQRLCPKYKNWGGVGWSAGRYNNDPDQTDWNVVAEDAMDYLFKLHDHAYQTGRSWLDADTDLLRGLCRVQVDGMYPKCYRFGAIVVFGVRSIKLSIFGDGHNTRVRTLPIPAFSF